MRIFFAGANVFNVFCFIKDHVFNRDASCFLASIFLTCIFNPIFSRICTVDLRLICGQNMWLRRVNLCRQGKTSFFMGGLIIGVGEEVNQPFVFSSLTLQRKTYLMGEKVITKKHTGWLFHCLVGWFVGCDRLGCWMWLVG